MLDESEWEGNRKALIDLYDKKNAYQKSEIEKLLFDLLVKKDAMEDVNRNLKMAGAKFALSTRESEVLKELLDGRTNSEISETLSVSLSTVKKHVYSIFNKIGVNSRAQLLTFVYTM